MSPEPDQTKWVGIRPTDPPEDIPVDAVRPAGTVSHLQMFRAPYVYATNPLNRDCTVMWLITLPAAAAGTIIVHTNINIMNYDSMCDMDIIVRFEGVERILHSFYSIPAGVMVHWGGFLPVDSASQIRGKWLLGGANDDMQVYDFGYIIGAY